MFHQRNAPGYNVREMAIIDGVEYAVPKDCAACGEFWKINQQTDGARYFVDGRWLCVACLEKKTPGAVDGVRR